MARRFERYRTGRRWLIVLGLVGCVVFHGLLLARLFLSSEQFRVRTERLLAGHFAGPVSVGGARYSLASGFRLSHLSLGRPADQGGGELLRVRAIVVDCRLLPLLRGRVVVDDLVLDQPTLYLTKRDLGGMKGGPAEATPAPVARVVIRGGLLVLGQDLLEEMKVAGTSDQELRSVNLELRKEGRLENGYAFEGSADSDLWGRCDLRGTVDLKRRRLDVAIVTRGITIGARLRQLLPAEYLRVLDLYNVQGSVDLTSEVGLPWDGSRPPELKATVDLRDCTATYSRFPLPCTDIRGRIIYDAGNFYYRDIVGRAGAASLEMSGQATGEKVEVHLVARGRPLDRELYATLPKELKVIWERLNVQGGTIDVDYHSTWTRESKRFEPVAQVQVRDGRGTYRNFPYPLEDVTGSFRWENFVTSFQGMVGRRGNARVELTGRLTDRGVPDILLRASDLPFDKTLREALTPGWRKTFDELQPQGTAAIECRVTSPTGDPDKFEYRITLRPEGASFQHKDFAHRIEDVRGVISVDETGTVALQGLRGKLGQIPLEFQGTVAASPKGPVLDLTIVAPDVELGPAARAILTPAWQTAYDELDPKGHVAVTWKLTTDPETGATRHRTEIRALRDGSVQHRQFPVRVTSLLGQTIIDAAGRTTFTGMKGRLENASVEALDGQYVPGPDGGLRFTLKARGLVLNDALRKAIPESWRTVWDEVQPSGEVDAEYQYASNPKDPNRSVQRVSIEPTDGAFCYKKLPLPVTDVARGKITFDPDGNTTLSNVEGKHQGKSVQLSGKAVANPDGAVLHLDVTVSEVPFDEKLWRLFPKEWQQVFEEMRLTGPVGVAASMAVNVRKAEWLQFRLEGALKGCEATYSKFPVRLSDLRGRIEYADGVTALTDLVGRCGVADQVLLDGRISRTEATPSRVRFRLNNLRCDAGFRAALPPDVRAALDKLAFAGSVDVDLTLTRCAKPDSPTESTGTVTLRDCSFRRSYDFEQVSGEVRIDKGLAKVEGSQEFAGTLHLRKAVFRRLVATGVDGHFVYSRTALGKDKNDPALSLEVSELGGSFYGGRISGKAKLDLAEGGPPKGFVLLSGVDLKEFATTAVQSKRRVSGVLNLRLEFPPGTLKDEKGLIGDGWASVDNGDLGDLPLAVAIFRAVSLLEVPERSLTKAEMKFGIAADYLAVRELLLGREGWMTMGSGKIGFDESLELRFITPRRGLITSMINLGVETLVQVELKGTLGEPKASTTTLPVRVFDEFKSLFGDWLRRSPAKGSGQ